MKVNELPYWKIEMILDGLNELTKCDCLIECRSYELDDVIELVHKFRNHLKTLPNPEQEKTGEREPAEWHRL